MVSTYTSNNGIEKPGSGDQADVWDVTANNNYDLLDTAIDGQVTVTLTAAGSSSSPSTLAITDGTASDGRNKVIKFVDAADLGATAYVQITPNDAQKVYFISNGLSGSRDIVLFQGTYSSGNALTIPNGKDVVVKTDGAGTGAKVELVLDNLDVSSINSSTPISLASGGTGGSTASAARDTFEVSGKVISKSASYTAVAADRSKLIRGTAAYTLSLTAAATLGDGWFIDVEAVTGDTTIDPNSTETIDGAATFTVPQGDTVRVRCDGSAFYTQFHEKAADVNARTLVVTGGSASAYTITAPSAITAYRTGQKFLCRAHTANTTGVTLNVDGLGVKNMRRYYGGAKTQLNSGHLQTDSMFEVIYDGTDFVVTSGLSGDGTRVGLLKVIDEDDFASNAAAWPPSQQSTKAYADNAVATMGGNQSGSAPVYAIRAWANYDGITPGIRASGNISSVTKVGTGWYRFYFTTAMADSSYAISIAYTNEVNVQHGIGFVTALTTTYFEVAFYSAADSSKTVDKSQVHVMVMR